MHLYELDEFVLFIYFAQKMALPAFLSIPIVISVMVVQPPQTSGFMDLLIY